MAVTAHYCVLNKHGHLVMRSHLAAFHHVSGAHSGENLAKHFLKILEDIGALQRVRNMFEAIHFPS